MGIRPWKRLMWQRVVGRGGSFSRRSGNLFWRGDDWAEIWFFVMKTQLPGRTVMGVGWGGWANAKHGFDCACYIWVCEMGWWSNEWGTVCMELRCRGGQDQISPGKRSRAFRIRKSLKSFQRGRAVVRHMILNDYAGCTVGNGWSSGKECLSKGSCRVKGRASSYSEPEQGG